jgi:hypothetical protein
MWAGSWILVAYALMAYALAVCEIIAWRDLSRIPQAHFSKFSSQLQKGVIISTTAGLSPTKQTGFHLIAQDRPLQLP